MSRSDTRGTIRELRLALERKKASPNAERDRREWGSGMLRWVRHYRKRDSHRRRQADRKEISRELRL